MCIRDSRHTYTTYTVNTVRRGVHIQQASSCLYLHALIFLKLFITGTLSLLIIYKSLSWINMQIYIKHVTIKTRNINSKSLLWAGIELSRFKCWKFWMGEPHFWGTARDLKGLKYGSNIIACFFLLSILIYSHHMVL